MSDKIGFSDLFDESFKADVKAATDSLAHGLQLAAEKSKELKATLASISGNKLMESKDITAYVTELSKGEKALNDFNTQMLRNQKIAAAQAAQQIKDQNAVNKATEERTKQEAKLTKELDKSTGTLNQVKKANSDLTKERNKLDLSTQQGRLRLTEINKELDKNNAFIKLNSSALEKQRLEIGAYKDAILEATGTGRLFGGVFGEIATKIRAVGEILTGVREQMKRHAEAVEASRAAIEANTVAEELNSAATEANSVAQEANTVATEASIVLEKEQNAVKEADIIVTDAETESTEKLTLAKRAFNAVTSTTGLILLAAAAAAKILYDNLTLTQERRDDIAAEKEADEQAAKSITSRIQNIVEIRLKTKELYYEEKRLEDLRIQSQVVIQNLRTEAAKSRLEAQEEGKTTKQKIESLSDYISKIEQVGKREEALANIEVDIAERRLAIDALRGDPNNREDKKKLEDAKTEALKIQEEDARELVRAQKQVTGLIDKDDADKRKMLQESQMRKVEAVQDSSKKEIAIENEKYKESLSNLKLEQKKSGIENKNFYSEEQSLLKLHYIKLEEIQTKEENKIFKIKTDTQELINQEDIKIREREIKNLEKEKKTPQLKKFNQEAALETSLKELRKKALVEKEKNDEIIANNTIDNTKELNAEIEKLQTKLNNDLLENDLDHQDKEKLIAEAKKEYLRRQLQEELNTTIDFADKIASAKDERNAKQIENDLDMRQRNIEQQQQLAESGYDNTLAFEKAAAAKDELRKEQLARKEEKRQKELAFFKLLASYADKGDGDQAVIKAMVQMAIAGAVAGSFFGGTESVEHDLSGNKVHGGRDGYVVAVDGTERIMTGAQNKMIGDLSNDDLANLARNYNDGILPAYITNVDTPSTATNMVNSMLLQQLAAMNSKFQSIEKILKERPTHKTDLTPLGDIVDTRIVNGITRITTKKNNSPLNYL